MLVTLQVKDEDADRAIGLLAWVVRFWGRLRTSDRAGWTKERSGPWDTALAGSSALRVAMLRLFRDEQAAHSSLPDQQSAILLWDVKGFYDSLRWDLVLEHALDLEFPPCYLALELQIRMAARFLREAGGFSQALQPGMSLFQ